MKALQRPLLLLSVLACGATSCRNAPVAAEATAAAGAAGQDKTSVFLDALPETLELEVARLAEEQEVKEGLTPEEEATAADILDEYVATTGHEHPDTFTFFRRLGARVSLVCAPLLVHPGPAERHKGLNALRFARPTLEGGSEAMDSFNEVVARPFLLRSTYDIDASVRKSAFASLSGIARISRRTGTARPPYVLARAEALLQDPDAGISRDAAHLLWEMGETRLLTDEQIAEFESGPRE